MRHCASLCDWLENEEWAAGKFDRLDAEQPTDRGAGPVRIDGPIFGAHDVRAWHIREGASGVIS
jgi:hypothetical protein